MHEAGAKLWHFRGQADATLIARFERELGVPRAAAELLTRRGFSEVESARLWLEPEAEAEHDPFLLPDLEAAAARLWRAIDAQERIVVHGDYDADGISGTALLCGALRALGARCEPFVPDRQRDGYGVAKRLIAHAIEREVAVLITVDTGSSAHEELAQARAGGIDVIVCDHHLFDAAPPANYFLNPQREDSRYPQRELCGCAVAYKLLCGMARLREGVDLEAQHDLLALAIIADQMELRGENRGLVRRGLARLSQRPRPGLAALLETARLHGSWIRAEDVAFQLAPRINAAGRIDSPRHALALLLTDDPSEARELAYRLDDLNRRRRELEQRMTEEALRDAEQWLHGERPAALVLASDRWHLGVVGISAARVAQTHELPVVVLAIEGDEARGSARSFGGLDLKAALDLCAGHLLRYGGHADAAGMTLRRADIGAFRAAFAAAARRHPQAASSGRILDAELNLAEFGPELVEFLERFGPFGAGHPAPVFASFGLRRLGDPRVVGERHLKLHMSGNGQQRSFIGFSMAQEHLAQARLWHSLDLAYRVRYRANSPYDPWELELVDLRQAEQPPGAMTA